MKPLLHVAFSLHVSNSNLFPQGASARGVGFRFPWLQARDARMMRRHKTNLRIGTKAHVDTVNNGDTVNHLPTGAGFFRPQ